MPRWELSWQAAAWMGLGLAVAAALLRLVTRRARWRTVASALWELGLLLGLFALWQVARLVSESSGVGSAMARGQWIWDAERTVYVPSETWFQGLFLGWPWLVQGFNFYYATMHFTGLGIALLWLFVRHRRHFRQARNVLILFTAASLLVQLMAVAPPRMLAGTGLVDTAARYGQSVYASPVGSLADEYSAMPSIHVGWALLVAIAVARATRSRWRWLGSAHAVITVVVVVATANHYWADGLVAAALLGLAYLVDRQGRLLLRRLRRPGTKPASESAPERAPHGAEKAEAAAVRRRLEAGPPAEAGLLPKTGTLAEAGPHTEAGLHTGAGLLHETGALPEAGTHAEAGPHAGAGPFAEAAGPFAEAGSNGERVPRLGMRMLPVAGAGVGARRAVGLLVGVGQRWRPRRARSLVWGSASGLIGRDGAKRPVAAKRSACGSVWV